MFLFHFLINFTLTPHCRDSDEGSAGSRGAAAAETALWSGQRSAGHPGGHGLEHHGGRVLPGPELSHQPPAEAAAERGEGRWVSGTPGLWVSRSNLDGLLKKVVC